MKLIRFGFVFSLFLASVPGLFAEKVVLRVGHFPNVTHAQALVASQLQRQGKGWFEVRLGPDVSVEWRSYNAGPSAMEAIFADTIDLTYVGPGPTLNAYLKARGTEIRVVSGAARGGSALVIQGDGRISQVTDFKGKKIATPQLGNTQDVAARVWMKKHGYQITQLGGDLLLLPTANPEQIALFLSNQIDGAWTVEPWVSRLELEGKGRIYIEEREAITTVLAASVKVLKTQPELVRKFVAAHVELTQWINAHPEEAKELVRAEIKELTKRELPAVTMDQAWPRLTFSTEISRENLDALLKDAQSVGFLKGTTDLGRLLEIQK